MAQANEGNIGVAADVVDDYDAICRVLQLCTDGEAKGDVGSPSARRSGWTGEICSPLRSRAPGRWGAECTSLRRA